MRLQHNFWTMKIRINFFVILTFFATIFLVFTRFFQLEKFPVGLTHDETVYSIQAKSLALQNTTVDQTLGWFSLQPIHSMYAEWPASLMAPFFWLTDNPIFATHLSTALIGVLLPFGFAYLVWGLWKDQSLSLIALLIGSVNPLWWQFGRLSFDNIYSLFFYIWGAAILVNFKNWQKLWSMPIFVLGFFEYQGLKLLLVPWVGLILLLQFLPQVKSFKISSLANVLKKYLSKPITIVFYLSILLTLIYGFLILPRQNVAGRLSRTIITDNDFLAADVNTQRRLSIQSPVNKLFSNKATQSLLFITKSYLNAFSPMLLFIQGEPQVSGFAVWSHGIFYLIDLLLIAVGMFAVFYHKKTRAQGFVLILMPVVFSLPSVINTLSEWYLIRQTLAYSSLLFFVIFAVKYIWQFNQLKWLFFVMYLLSVVNFVYQYYYRYPIYSADSQEVQERVIARYITLAKQVDPEINITVYTPESERYFTDYLLYSNQFNLKTKDEVAQAYRQQMYQLEGVEFVSGCVDLDKAGVIIGEVLILPCQEKDPQSEEIKIREKILADKLSIPAVLDSGETFKIYKDTLCQGKEMNQFLMAGNLDLFAVEKMDADQFCQIWIKDLRGF